MKTAIAVILSLASGALMAQEISFGYGAANELILKGKNCQELIQQHEAICAWKKNIEPAFVKPALAKTCKVVNGLKTQTVSACLPTFVKANHHKKLVRSGGNCWGTAMSFKQLSNKPRFLWPEEMTYWMNSPVCRKLDVGEEKQPGDIINVYGPEYIFEKAEKDKGYRFWEALFPGRNTTARVASGYSGYHNFLHSETYISGLISFGKDSPSKDDRFDFHSTNEIYGRSQDEECQENQSLEPYSREYQNPPKNIKGSSCDYFSIAYRCGNIKEYFAKQKLDESEKAILDQVEQLQKTQEKLFTLQTTTAVSVNSFEIKKIVELADTTAVGSLIELQKTSNSKNREMLLVLQYFSASGLRKSLEQARLIPATESL